MKQAILQRLKDRAIALPDRELEELRIWINAIAAVRAEMARPAKKKTNKTAGGEKNETGNL